MSILWLVPLFPLLGFLTLALGRRMPERPAAFIGTGSVFLSMLAAAFVSADFLLAPPASGSFTLVLWRWLGAGDPIADISFTLDSLSAVMMLMVTGVGFLIHLYSTAHMAGHAGYARFFAHMNLFVASMLVLVLADNLLLLYLGWEGVGLCSFLLIGFKREDPAAGSAARKAFIVTRIGDVSLLLGILLIGLELGTLEIGGLSRRAASAWAPGSHAAMAAALLILGGAVGKSAQLPLQTWLPDAMAGPTPVSALIHAATMVTAGVYLIARLNAVFLLSPAVMGAVGIIGAAGILVAGLSALTQRDIKRILAYSTISQLGYMFLALGAGAWAGAVFHLVTHAFFKALLFLSAGVVIEALGEERDVYAMGGLARKMPFTFAVFLIGAFSLTALPLVTAGFSSKDLILAIEWGAGGGGRLLWGAGILGVFLTSGYTFRMVFLTFIDAPRSPAGGAAAPEKKRLGAAIVLPLLLLAGFCMAGGLLNLPATLGGAPYLTDFLQTVLPREGPVGGGGLSEWGLELISLGVSLAGIPFAYVLYRRELRALRAGPVSHAEARGLRRFLRSGWGFDPLYERVIVRPFRRIVALNAGDIVNGFWEGVGGAAASLSGLLRSSQTGRIRMYAAAIAAGGLLVLAAVMIL